MATVKKDALYGIFDQGLISLSNLGIGFLLIKLTSKENYGLYGIGFAAILLCVGVANALVTTQMTVFAPEKPDKIKYCCTMLLGQYFIFIPLWIIFAVFSFAVFYLKIITADLFTYALVLSATVMTAIFHEFMRRYFYIDLKPYRVLQIDIVNVIVIFGSLILMVIYKLNVSHISAVIIYGAAALMAGLTGLMLSKLLQKLKLTEIINSIKEAWHHGLWALGGVIVTWLQSQSYVALLSILATTASIAEANAARLFLAPVSIISSSLAQVFIPRLAILRNAGEHDAITRLTQRILLLIMAVICLVVLITFLIKDYILGRFFPKEYANIGPLVLLWALVFVAQAICSNASILLQIYKKFKAITVCNFYTAIATALMTWFLIKLNGIDGSIQAMALGQLLLALLLWRAFHAYKKN
jgi:O-antigen/teichoic acid export membrane protein